MRTSIGTWLPTVLIAMAPQFETVKVSFNHLLFFVVSYQSQPPGNKQSFVDVPITADGVETVSFLEAADGLMNLFGM